MATDQHKLEYRLHALSEIYANLRAEIRGADIRASTCVVRLSDEVGVLGHLGIGIVNDLPHTIRIISKPEEV